MSEELLVLGGGLLAGVAFVVYGWVCWTGRWKGWARPRHRYTPVSPLMLPMGTGWLMVFAGFTLTYLDDRTGGGDGPLVQVGGALLGLGLLVGLAGMASVYLVYDPHATYAKHPDGSRRTRLLLPRWYHEQLVREASEGGGDPGRAAYPP